MAAETSAPADSIAKVKRGPSIGGSPLDNCSLFLCLIVGVHSKVVLPVFSLLFGFAEVI
jgi:hypothetical protein